MRSFALVVATLIFCFRLYAGEGASEPMPRTEEYDWMSIASWNEQHAIFARRAREGNVDILFLGDSITDRWANSAVWQKYYAPSRAVNFGMGGDTTQNVLWRITVGGELEGMSPKVIVLLIGTNNLDMNGEKPDEVAGGVETIVRTLRTKLPTSRIVLLGIFPREQSADSPIRGQIKAVNERIAKLDDKMTIRYLDIGTDLVSKDGSLSIDVMPDFLHLSERGYEIWAARMNPLLVQMLGN